MIKIVDIKIDNKNSATTNIYFKFEDNNVNYDRYNFLKERLDNFKLYIDKDYTTENEIQYNEISKQMIIKIFIIIPDKYMPQDFEKCTEIIMNKINLFRNFYEAQNEIYKHSKI
jgi:hypothetical protein